MEKWKLKLRSLPYKLQGLISSFNWLQTFLKSNGEAIPKTKSHKNRIQSSQTLINFEWDYLF